MTTQIKGDATSTFGSDINVTGNVVTDAPAFSAYQSNQTITSQTWTKLQFDDEVFDTANCYDTTNYRFTPNIAGYYQVNCACKIDSGNTRALGLIYKNGSILHRLFDADEDYLRVASGSALVYLNGSTDYIEIYAYRDGTSGDTNASVSSHSHFQAFLARAV